MGKILLFFLLLQQQPTQSTTSKIEKKKNGVLHTQSTRHRLFIKKRLARRQLSLKNPVPPYMKSSPDVHLPAHPLNSHSSSWSSTTKTMKSLSQKIKKKLKE